MIKSYTRLRWDLGYPSRLMKRAGYFVRARVRSWKGDPFLRNVNGVPTQNAAKRALFVYRTEPFLLDESFPAFQSHESYKQAKQIASVLGEQGYVVDVADASDKRFEVRERYDLIVCHRTDLKVSEENLGESTRRVYLASGMNHTFHNEAVRGRYAEVKKRKGVDLKIRQIVSEDYSFVRRAHAIAGFGNASNVGSWGEIVKCPVFPFNNWGWADPATSGATQIASGRRRFLYYASGSQVRKGLDLLLEVAREHHEWELFICSGFEFEEDFCRCYREEMFSLPNVHAVGWTNPGSPAFREISALCEFVILPSCEEGQPGSVVQAMHRGLIPVVTRESGIDVSGFGLQIRDISVAGVADAMARAASLSDDQCDERHRLTSDIAKHEYSERSFLSRWREIVCQIERIPMEKRSME